MEGQIGSVGASVPGRTKRGNWQVKTSPARMEKAKIMMSRTTETLDCQVPTLPVLQGQEALAATAAEHTARSSMTNMRCWYQAKEAGIAVKCSPLMSSQGRILFICYC